MFCFHSPFRWGRKNTKRRLRRQIMRNIFNFLSISWSFISLLFSSPHLFLSLTSCHQGVTTMLNFFTTSNGFRSTLPVVSNLTAMNIWDGVCMCFIYASLLEFVCVNYVGRKRPLHNVVYRPGENPVTQVNRLLWSPSCLHNKS